MPLKYINLMFINWNCLCVSVMGAWGMKCGLELIPHSWEAAGPEWGGNSGCGPPKQVFCGTHHECSWGP